MISNNLTLPSLESAFSYLFKIKNGAPEDEKMGLFPFPLALPGERGRDPCSSHWGRSFICRRLASKALDHCTARALPRDRRLLAPPRVPSLREGLRGRLRCRARGEPLVPLAARPHLRSSSCARSWAAGADWAAWDWRPSRTSGLFGGREGLPGAGRCLVPTEKDRKEPSLNPVPLRGAGRGGETGA